MARSAAQARKPRQRNRGPKQEGQKKGQKQVPAKKGSKGKAVAGKKKARTRTGKEKPAKPATAEELDAAMDDYWMKSGKKEVVGKKLDDEMDAYWEKKNAAKEGEAGEDAAAAVDEKPEAS